MKMIRKLLGKNDLQKILKNLKKKMKNRKNSDKYAQFEINTFVQPHEN